MCRGQMRDFLIVITFMRWRGFKKTKQNKTCYELYVQHQYGAWSQALMPLFCLSVQSRRPAVIFWWQTLSCLVFTPGLFWNRWFCSESILYISLGLFYIHAAFTVKRGRNVCCHRALLGPLCDSHIPAGHTLHHGRASQRQIQTSCGLTRCSKEVDDSKKTFPRRWITHTKMVKGYEMLCRLRKDGST